MTGPVTLPVPVIEDWLAAIYRAAGLPDGEAVLVARHLVDADASGHPSHGIVRTPRYLEYLANGTVTTPARPETLLRTDALALLDGRFGFGQVLGHVATDLLAEMVAETGVAVLALRNAGHLGRIGAWAEILADRGLVSIHFVTVAGSRLVAPFGAASRAMSTAPVTVGVPNRAADGTADHFILDFATSRVAEGKALVALGGGPALPADALVAADGADSADPRVLYGASADTGLPDPKDGPGALQAMGQHKGSGLALACELLAGALTGAGTNADPNAPFCNGMLSIALDPARLDVDGAIRAEVEAYVAFVRAARPRTAGAPVLIPGDPERARCAAAAEGGITLRAGLAAALREASARHGVPVPEAAGTT